MITKSDLESVLACLRVPFIGSYLARRKLAALIQAYRPPDAEITRLMQFEMRARALLVTARRRCGQSRLRRLPGVCRILDERDVEELLDQ